jgi:hypothetical protein
VGEGVPWVRDWCMQVEEGGKELLVSGSFGRILGWGLSAGMCMCLMLQY